MSKRILAMLVIAGVMGLAAALLPMGSDPRGSTGPGGVFVLKAPPFIGAGRAEALAGASVIENEAGISAYFQASGSIDLNLARRAFRTIEIETSEYIIGSVPLSGYNENADVHVYVHRDGWVVAYYPSGKPVSMIFDWVAYHNGGRTALTTRLESALRFVASQAGISYPGATFYHFQHPNATHLMLIAEWTNQSSPPDSFQVRLPGTLIYYEQSWSLATNDIGYLYLDDTQIARVSKTSVDPVLSITEGFFSATQLSPGPDHTIAVRSGYSYYYTYGGLALLYRRP